MQEVYITKKIGEICVAGLNTDRELVYLAIERDIKPTLVGQISMGRVIEVNKSQSLAYVDMGNCHALLNTTGKLCEGDVIPLQIIRDGNGDKLPAVHTRLTVENRYFTMSTTAKGVKYSRGVGKGKLRADIENKMREIAPDANGITVKKNATILSFSDLQKAYNDICAKMDILQEKIIDTKKVTVLLPSIGAVTQSFYDVNCNGGVIVDCPHIYNDLSEMAKNTPDIQVVLYKDSDLFDHYAISDDIEQALLRKIDVSGGGSIVIDTTEALTAIDVNGGGLDSLNRGDDAIFRLNKRAAKAIAKHVAVRNISGLIVIDFVTIKNRGMEKQIPKILASEMRFYDPSGVWDIMEITKSGLVEMTRKRTRPSLSEIMFSPLGERSVNAQTMGLQVLQKLLSATGAGIPTIYCSKVVKDILQIGELSLMRKSVETTIAKDIVFEISEFTSVELKR